MPLTTFIFDFDGTIADNLRSVIKIFKKLSIQYSRKELSDSEIDILRNKTIKEAFQYMGFSIWRIPFIVKRIREELNKEMVTVRPFAGIKETLRILKVRGYKLGIISSNSQENISIFINQNKLNYFDFIFSGSSLFGKAKVLQDYLKRNRLGRDEVIYIGDEIRDIEAARKVRIKIAAVTWGFNKKEILQSSNPDYLIEKPRDLLQLLRNKNYH